MLSLQSFLPRQSGGKGRSIQRTWYKMSTFEEIRPEFEISTLDEIATGSESKIALSAVLSTEGRVVAAGGGDGEIKT